MAVKVLVVIFLMGFSYVASATYSTVGYNSVDLESEENLRKLYSTWVAKHGLVRKSPSEQRNRYRIFKRNLNYIEQHNKRSRDSSTDSYWLGLNHFADMTREEFTSTYSNSKIATITEHKATNFSHVDLHRDRLPLVVDWRQRGAVTGVKNQGKSAHGWAFSSTAAVEGINKIMRRSLISLSEQELLDCVSCSSDCVAQAFQLIIDNGGIDTEDSYPYTGSQAVCNQELLNRRVVSIDGYEYVPQKNEAELKRSASQQPVSVWIEISNNDLQFYSGGIFIGKCGSNIDHAVLVVGYGSRNGRPYWLIKNSWGSTWGEKGYMRIERNVKSPSGKCGIAMMPSYPVQKIARCGSRTLCPA